MSGPLLVGVLDAARGFGRAQVCSLERPCDYPGHVVDGRV
jgi:hypothetical protein